MSKISMDDDSEIIRILKDTGAFLKGHFLLSSGLHSDTYIQCAKALRFPKYTELFGNLIANSLNENIDCVVSPAMGGILIGYEVARALKTPFLFTERDEKGEMNLRRGQKIKKGDKILIVEDVITTGKSTLEVSSLVNNLGGIVTSISCIVNRSKKEFLNNFKIVSLISVETNTYQKEECPLCAQGIELIKPGSRKIIK